MDDTQFERAVERHRTQMIAVARRIVGEADAEDIVQEALIRLWHRSAQFIPNGENEDAYVAAWMLKTVVRLCFNFVGRTIPARRRAEEEYARESHHSVDTPEENYSAQEILDAIKTLDPKDRDFIQSLIDGERPMQDKVDRTVRRHKGRLRDHLYNRGA